MGSLRLLALIAMGALTVSACATSNTVQLEDGSTAHDISCFGGAWSCKTEAESICGNRPYIVLDDSPMLELASKGQQGSSRIQCVDDQAAANAPAAPAQPARTKATDGEICSTVYREIGPLSKAWANARHGEPKVEPPPVRMFVDTCATLPREAQVCLSAIYRKRHDTCPKVLGALDDEAKARLDATLLSSRRPEPSEAPPPGTLSL